MSEQTDAIYPTLIMIRSRRAEIKAKLREFDVEEGDLNAAERTIESLQCISESDRTRDGE